MKRPRGVVIWEGASLLNGEPIVLIATFNTENTKTGNLIQTWIVLQDKHPIEAINTGEDEANCGNCILRGIIAQSQRKNIGEVNRERGCYVSVSNGGPSAIWRAYNRGSYPVYSPDEHEQWFRNRGMRVGSYGDPTAVPLSIWLPLFSLVDSRPGYTHQWKTCNQDWKNYIMASTHTLEELEEANLLGWRSYRTRKENGEIAKNEIICPASKEAGFKKTCETCRACEGGSLRKKSIVIIAHGGRYNKQFAEEISK